MTINFLQAIEEGPREAAKTLAKGIEYRALVIPRKLKALDKRAVAAKSQEVVVSGVSSLLKATRHPIQTAKEVSSNLSQIYKQMFPPKQAPSIDMDMLMNELDEEADTAEAEAKAKKEEALAISLKQNRIQAKPKDSKYSTKSRRGGVSGGDLIKPPIKVDLPDCTLVTVTLNMVAPPAAVLEHTYGQKMFIKARDKVLKKRLEMKKAKVDGEDVEIQPPDIRNNFHHNDDEEAEETARAVTKTVISKPKKVKKKKKQAKIYDDDGKLVIERTPSMEFEEELAREREKLPTALQDPKKTYNNRARTEFENQFVFDLALACGIPEKYFSIEEVRNLPNNDPKVAEYIDRNKVKLNSTYYKLG